MSFDTNAVREPKDLDDPVYPCVDCGKLRSANQGAHIFIDCDTCWDKLHPKKNKEAGSGGKETGNANNSR
jgi:hypothetical protein